MKKIIHKADTRGHFNYGWLDTHHTFSFAKYNNEQRINFGALRVLNDDLVQPGEGFGKHPHDNMEIITIPLEGKILHRDSMGHDEIIKTGDVQVMSAGTGVFHEEYNGSKISPVNFLQIWIYPNTKDVQPNYKQQNFNAEDAVDTWQELVSNSGERLKINQNAKVSRVFLSEGESIEYEISSNSYGSYIFNIFGEITIDELTISKRDGIGITGTNKILIKANTDSHLLNIEVPQ